MSDLVYENDRKVVLKLREELKMAKKEITMLRKLLKEKEKEQEQPKTSTLVFTKAFQKYYREAYGVGYIITKWAAANLSMFGIVDLFYSEGYTDEDIHEFLKWSVNQKTHTDGHMTIPYLKVLVQDYFHMIAKKEYSPVVEDPPEVQDKIRQSLSKRFS